LRQVAGETGVSSVELAPNAQLVGRDQDISVVFALVDHAARHGGSLLVSGGAGIGKTALIEAAAAYAASGGVRLLLVSGAQFEANVSFAALHQLLFPLLDSDLSRLFAACAGVYIGRLRLITGMKLVVGWA
jgi:hypothetical protein